MPLASFNKFDQFVADVAAGVHNMKTGTSHVFKVLLTNTAPVATNAVKADLTEISAGSGYTAGGISGGTVTGSQTSGVFTFIVGTDPVWTASGGSIGPVRYAVMYNDTPTSPADPLVGWWDYGSSVTVNSGETFTVDLGQVSGVLTIT